MQMCRYAMLHSSHLPLPCASVRTVSRSPSLPPPTLLRRSALPLALLALSRIFPCYIELPSLTHCCTLYRACLCCLAPPVPRPSNPVPCGSASSPSRAVLRRGSALGLSMALQCLPPPSRPASAIALKHCCLAPQCRRRAPPLPFRAPIPPSCRRGIVWHPSAALSATMHPHGTTAPFRPLGTFFSHLARPLLCLAPPFARSTMLSSRGVSTVVWCPIATFSYPHGAVSRRTAAPFRPSTVSYVHAPFLLRTSSPSRSLAPAIHLHSPPSSAVARPAVSCARSPSHPRAPSRRPCVLATAQGSRMPHPTVPYLPPCTLFSRCAPSRRAVVAMRPVPPSPLARPVPPSCAPSRLHRAPIATRRPRAIAATSPCAPVASPLCPVAPLSPRALVATRPVSSPLPTPSVAPPSPPALALPSRAPSCAVGPHYGPLLRRRAPLRPIALPSRPWSRARCAQAISRPSPHTSCQRRLTGRRRRRHAPSGRRTPERRRHAPLYAPSSSRTLPALASPFTAHTPPFERACRRSGTRVTSSVADTPQLAGIPPTRPVPHYRRCLAPSGVLATCSAASPPPPAPEQWHPAPSGALATVPCTLCALICFPANAPARSSDGPSRPRDGVSPPPLPSSAPCRGLRPCPAFFGPDGALLHPPSPSSAPLPRL
ncbi:hypothetical protein DENSPDRAFT_886229 [Dentipellis sp. KUC8613]|nr:hypothetical protein DENSPDRAFT_886229 [Dentipellis sp. KUC8613]